MTVAAWRFKVTKKTLESRVSYPWGKNGLATVIFLSPEEESSLTEYLEKKWQIMTIP